MMLTNAFQAKRRRFQRGRQDALRSTRVSLEPHRADRRTKKMSAKRQYGDTGTT